MAARCIKHTFDFAVAQCSACYEPFCTDCVVYPRGPKKPPTCVPCALVAAGVRRLSAAEKKAIKANRGKKVDLAPPGTELPGRLVVAAEEPEPGAAVSYPPTSYESVTSVLDDAAGVWTPGDHDARPHDSRPLEYAPDEYPAPEREPVGAFVGGGGAIPGGDTADAPADSGRRFGRFGRR